MPRELVIAGPAGTGKTRGVLNFLHCLCDDYPNLRVLIMRARRSDLTESTLVTFEQEVLAADGRSKLAEGVQRKQRHSYKYPNGSEIVLAGLDRSPTKVRSSAWDIIYANEASELQEASYEEASSRLERPGRSSRFGWLISDTNPAWPTHWLKKRCDAGRAVLWTTLHKANPAMWTRQGWTPAGLRYLAKLDTLTGHRLQRLRYGRWVAAEGAVYDAFNPQIHVCRPFEIPYSWTRYRVVDFGFTNPFVVQWWAQDPDGRLYRYREMYRTRTTVANWAGKILDASGPERLYDATVADHDREDRQTLHDAGILTIPAHKAVLPGIEAVQNRLAVQADGKPRLMFFPDDFALWGGRDDSLSGEGKPTSTLEEVESYRWAVAREGKAAREEPVKLHDHGMDAMRYLVAHADDIGRSEWKVY